MANIATITNNIISALSGTTSQVLLGDATLTDFKLDSLTDVSVPTPGDGDVLRWNGTTSLWEASDAAGVTGSGANGRVAFWTGANTQSSNSNLFWDNTNNRLGIGYAGPATGLDVRGTSNTAASTIQIVGNSVSTLLLGQNADGGIVRGQGGNNVLSFWTGGSGDTGAGQSGTEKMRISAAGNVLIGITERLGNNTNTNPLQVYGGVTISAASGIYTYATLQYSGTDFQITANAHPANLGGGNMVFRSGTAGGGGPTEWMRITSAGNVGIGTTAPNTSLVVRGNTSGYDKNIIVWERATDGAVQGTLGFGKSVGAANENNVYVGSITAHPLLLQTNNIERLRITDTGNVGVGTAAPAYKFEVQTSGISTPLRLLQTNYQSLTVDYPALYTTQINFAVFGRIEYDGNGGVMTISNRSTQALSSSMGFVMGTTERMRITDTGNVGIGITTPATKLEVFDSVTTQLRVRMSGQADMRIIADTGYGAISNDSNMPLVLRTNATERMRITASGDIGIGTAAATNKLTIVGNIESRVVTTATATTNYLRLATYPDGSLGSYIAVDANYPVTAGTNIKLGTNDGTGFFDRLVISANGNIGIGIATPSTDLHISKPGSRTLRITNSTNSTDVELGISTALGTVGTSTANAFAIVTSNTERMRISATGDVGIGTTTPTGKFEVTGGSGNVGVASYFSAYTGYSTPSAGNAGIPAGAKIVLWNNTGGQRAYIGMDASADIWFNNAGMQGGAGFTFYTGDGLSAAPVARLKVHKNGNVGIGTTDPTYLLHVNGDALINGVRVGKGPNSLSGNTVLGASALNGVTTGNNNVAIGPNALDGTTTGNYNIAIGFMAGGIGAAENTTGSNNIFIGTEIQGQSSTESNRTWIGSNTTSSTWLGGNLLLGTVTNSTYKLDVVGTTRISNGLYVSGGLVAIQTLAGSGTAIVVTDNAGNLSTQPTTTYLSSLSGEATNSGSVVTLTNSAVIGKVLTGLNVNSAAITASDSILSAFGKLQGQIDGLQGGTIYKGSWNASTNTPTITSGTGTQGHYYVVTTAGTTTIDGVSSWAVGDWIIFNGTVWEKIPNVDAITSVNGQTGVVSLTTSNISEGTNLYYTDARARGAISLTTSGSSGASTYSSGVLNIPTYTLAGLGGVASGTTITINGVAQDLSTNRTYSVGTVTSIGLAVPTGFTATSAITSSGDITLGFAAGYSLPTTASQTNWDTAYNRSATALAYNGSTGVVTLTKQDTTTLTATITLGPFTTSNLTEGSNLYYTDARARAAITLTTSGTSGAATYSSGVLNIPQYQSVLTNPVTGTGTSGHVAFFNGATSITGESNLFWDATNNRLGINNAAPSYSLHVTGNGYFSDSVRMPNNKALTFEQTGGSILGGISMTVNNAVTLSNNSLLGVMVYDDQVMLSGKVGIGHSGNIYGGASTALSMVNSLTTPSSSFGDSFIMYSSDVVAGNAAPHFRTENGAVIKLYRETTAVGNSIFLQGGGNSVLDDSTFDGYTLRQVVKALRNQGILQ
jgi:hypothetical protein